MKREQDTISKVADSLLTKKKNEFNRKMSTENIKSKSLVKILLLATYPPRECGIAVRLQTKLDFF